jgi:hypothetical protein
MLGGGAFLTEVVRQGILPTDFTDDVTFAYTADTPYRQVEYVEGGLVTFLGVPAVLWLFGTPVVLLGAVTVIVVAARRSARGRREAAGRVEPSSPRPDR